MFVPGLVTGDIITKIGPAWTIMLGMLGRGGASGDVVRGRAKGSRGMSESQSMPAARLSALVCPSRPAVLLREHCDRVHQLPSRPAALRHGDMPHVARGSCNPSCKVSGVDSGVRRDCLSQWLPLAHLSEPTLPTHFADDPKFDALLGPSAE